jgi:hypothetical protein
MEIVFNHDSWTVVTSAWTVGSKRSGTIVICYPWSALSGLSGWGDSATGVARLEIAMSMNQFLEHTKTGQRTDLRGYQ